MYEIDRKDLEKGNIDISEEGAAAEIGPCLLIFLVQMLLVFYIFRGFIVTGILIP